MGEWNYSCVLSGLPIECGTAIMLPLMPNKEGSLNDKERVKYFPLSYPLRGHYNGSGEIERIERDDNTIIIEEHYGISVQEFANHVAVGQWTPEYKKVPGLEESRTAWLNAELHDMLVDAEPSIKEARDLEELYSAIVSGNRWKWDIARLLLEPDYMQRNMLALENEFPEACRSTRKQLNLKDNWRGDGIDLRPFLSEKYRENIKRRGKDGVWKNALEFRRIGKLMFALGRFWHPPETTPYEWVWNDVNEVIQAAAAICVRETA